MPEIDLDGHRCHYRDDGPVDAPVVVLSHALGANLDMWGYQVEAWSTHWRVLRLDLRGQGRSAVSADASIERLGRDVLALTEALGIQRFSFCGLSMSGLIGCWLGLEAADRLDRLVLCNTAPQIGTAEQWNERAAQARQDGLAALADSAMQRWFSPAYAQANPEVVEHVRQQVLSCPPEGYARACEAIRDADFRARLHSLRTPTLVLTGEHDAGAGVEACAAFAAALPRARTAVVDAAHLSNVGDRAAFNTAVEEFLRA